MVDPNHPHLSRYGVRRRKRSYVLVLVAVLAVLVWAGWTLTRGPVVVPDWVTQRVEQRIDRSIASTGLTSSIEGLEFHLRGGGTPVLTANGLALKDAAGVSHLDLSRFEAVAAPMALSRGEPLIPVLRLSGLHFGVLRDETGALTVKLGDETLANQIRSPGDLVDRLRALFSNGALAQISTLGIENLAITFANEETGNALTTSEGTLRIQKDGADLNVAMDLGNLVGQENAPAVGRVRIDLHSAAITKVTTLDLNVGGVVPAYLASVGGHNALTTLLKRLDAPVALDLSARVGSDGALTQFTGKISVGDGRLLLPEASQESIPLDWAKGEVHLDGDLDRLELRNLDISAGPLSLTGEVHLLVDNAQGLSGPVVVQTALTRLHLELPDLLDTPVSFDALNADIRVQPDRNQIEIANLRAQTGDTWITAKANVSRDQEGGSFFGADISAEKLDPETVLRMWPKHYTPPTREWLTKKLSGGVLQNVQAAVRKTGSDPVQLGLSFGFSDASISPLKWLPPITDASGVVQISGTTLSVGIDQAQLQLETGDVIDLGGGLVRLPDIRERNGTLEVGFDVDAETASALRLLALPGFRGKPAEGEEAVERPKPILRPEDAVGDLALRAELAIPLYRSTRMKDVTYQVTGVVRDFSSQVLVPGKDLSTDTLDLSASPDGLVISGSGQLEGNPLKAKFWRSLSREPELRGLAKLTATAPLTGALLRDWGLPLSANDASGQGNLDITLDIKPGESPQLELAGNLRGLGLRVPSLSWSKSARSAGSAVVSARLGRGGALDTIDVTAPGLRLTGRAGFAPGGQGLSKLTLSRLDVGNWLRTSAQITPGQNGSGGLIGLTGGVLDLRNRPRGGGGGGNGPKPRMDVALDRIVLNDGITLTGTLGSLSERGEGQLSAKVNGGPAVTVDIGQTDNGASYRIRSGDAGATIRAAGLIRHSYGGALDLRLVPTGGTGNYKGKLRIKDTTMRDAPVIAELVSGLSIVGAFEQASEGGIPFSDVRADFRLSPGALILESASAVGASIGLSLDGRVDLSNRRMALQGVVSPVYFLNRAGSFMTRRGEGLLGMTFRVDGSLDKPKLSANPLSILTPGFLREIFRDNK